MSNPELLDQVLALPEEPRAELITKVIASLESHEEPDAVEAAWRDEVARRVAEIEAGTAKTIPAAEAMAQVRASVRRVRKA